MTDRPLVIKLGGDALASPQRIAAQARRLARHAAAAPLVAVASARRGVTDHLLSLTQLVLADLEDGAALPVSEGVAAERDRAVASGEVVSASLLALALNRLGVRAVSLDAREAGIESRGNFGEAHIKQVAAGKLERLLNQGVVPIVTGFQGWQRGRVATLGRGGTDTSAVAITLALGGSHTIFVKEAHGLRTADPKLVPEAERIALAPHAFLSALTAAGAKVVQAEAAALAEQHALRLEFWSLDSDGPDSVVEEGANAERLRAVATEGGRVTALAGQATQLVREGETLRLALTDLGIAVREIQPAANGLRFVVPEHRAVEATRALHAAFVSCRPEHNALRAS